MMDALMRFCPAREASVTILREPDMSEDTGHDFHWNGFTHVCGKCGKTEQAASGYGEQIMPCRPGAGYDLCECGDYRHQHKDGEGECSLNGLGHGGAPACLKFRMSKS
jgi:hypothetical protein